MPKSMELHKVLNRLSPHGIVLEHGGKHPHLVDPKTGVMFPVKCHGPKTEIHPYALNALRKLFNLPRNIFD